MKHLIVFIAFLAMAQASASAGWKYGFLGDSDEQVLATANDDDIGAIVLGCIYKYEPPTTDLKHAKGLEWKVFKNYITVVESFKGPLKVGQKAVVIIYAEEGPSREEALGELHFYFLRKKDSKDSYVPDGGFTCDWTECVSYSEYNFLRNLLLKLEHHEKTAEQGAAATP